jgi:hypothetical protein
MAGVVFANSAGLTKWSPVITLSAGAVPPGTWILQQAGTLTVTPGGTPVTVTVPLGVPIDSDGVNLVTTAGGGVLLGTRPKPVWPWPTPWPLSIMS